ncbi:MAG: pyridoxal phosphate-dependent aminotransferase [Bacilli bacterium]
MVLEKYGHGADLESATEVYGQPENGWLDFSVNCNPFAPVPGLYAHLEQQLRHQIERYPDPAYRKFRACIAEVYNVDMKEIVVGNGASELLALAVSAYAPLSIGVTAPSFSLYGRISAQHNAVLREYETAAYDNFVLDVATLHTMMEENECIILCHPNNPNGALLSDEVIAYLKNEIPKYNGLVVIDEAFLDFVIDAKSFIQFAVTQKNIVVVTSLTKIYSIPGLRAGFLVATSETAEKIRAKTSDWNVNGLSEAASMWCLQQHIWKEKTVHAIQKEREWLQTELEKIGIKIYKSETNYLLLSLKIMAKEMQNALAKDGILIRNCSMYRGLNDFHVRVCVSTRENNLKLIEKMQQVLERNCEK